MSKTIVFLDFDSVIVKVTPEIVPEKGILLRPHRDAISQLRSGYCLTENSYKHRSSLWHRSACPNQDCESPYHGVSMFSAVRLIRVLSCCTVCGLLPVMPLHSFFYTLSLTIFVSSGPSPWAAISKRNLELSATPPPSKELKKIPIFTLRSP